MHHYARAVTVLMLGLAIAGCGKNVIAKADVEKGSKDALQQKVGIAPKAVTCPGDLDATVGASERCTLTAPDGTTIGMTVTVQTIDAATANATYGVAVDGPSPSPAGTGSTSDPSATTATPAS